MKRKQYVTDFAAFFVVVLVVNLLVTYLYGFIVHGSGVWEWESAFIFAISLGIVLPWLRRNDAGAKAQ